MITAQHPRQFITVQGEKIGYLAIGKPTNPALLFVHGWLSHAGFWRDSLNRFSDRFYCVAVDLLGFGMSAKPPAGDYSILAQAQRIIAVADALNLKTFALLGHSMGGQVALMTARHFPQRLSKLMIMGSVVDGKVTPYLKNIYRLPLWLGYYVPQTWGVSRLLMSRLRPYKHLFLDNAMTYRKDVIPLNSPDIPMATQPGIERPAYLAFWAFQACDLTPELPYITTRTLIIAGKQDNTVPVSSSRLAHECLPKNQFVLLNPCGHTPNVEEPAQYYAVLENFLVD